MGQLKPILAVSDVRRDYGGLKAVDGASFSAMPGRITGLIGPNGAGKSTLIGIIGGQKRLLEIMRARRPKPTMLLLEEPFAGVNPTLARQIEQYLLDLRDEGLSMIMVEHELAVVERLCEPVVVMAQGKVISEGSMRYVSARKEVLDAYLVG